MDEAAAVARSERKDRPPFWEPEGRDTEMQGDSFTVFKNMTLHGYYTSEIGFTQELKLQIIPGAQHGCMPLGPGLGDPDA
jgi:hypothetical protein